MVFSSFAKVAKYGKLSILEYIYFFVGLSNVYSVMFARSYGLLGKVSDTVSRLTTIMQNDVLPGPCVVWVLEERGLHSSFFQGFDGALCTLSKNAFNSETEIVNLKRFFFFFQISKWM